ncbi:MAG TPA: hypothetical protein PLM53_20340 [Spirochaetota bacterium]|nr:hypothetical protein [Spirochaetota bacterium]HQH99445.1 hypothetical protein [Spirochaetota bacterium]
MKTTDWPTIRAEYIAGAKPRQLSEKYNVNYETVRQRIRREKWRAECTESSRKCTQNYLAKYADKLADKQLEVKERYATGNEKLAVDILNALNNTKNPRELAALARAYNEVRKGVFACYDIAETTKIQGDPDKPMQHITTHEIPMEAKKEIVALFIARQQ